MAVYNRQSYYSIISAQLIEDTTDHLLVFVPDGFITAFIYCSMKLKFDLHVYIFIDLEILK